MHVAELWRFPVKSMAGEPLGRADVRPDGIVGDRVAYVLGAHGRIVTARTRPRLLGHRATLGMDGEPQVDGRPWRAPGVERDVVAAVGVGASLVLASGLERFDVLPLLVATDGAIRALGADGRRLRPNIVIGGVSGLDERTWEGARQQAPSQRSGAQRLDGRAGEPARRGYACKKYELLPQRDLNPIGGAGVRAGVPERAGDPIDAIAGPPVELAHDDDLKSTTPFDHSRRDAHRADRREAADHGRGRHAQLLEAL